MACSLQDSPPLFQLQRRKMCSSPSRRARWVQVLANTAHPLTVREREGLEGLVLL